jgi:hypothetical protein
MFGPKSCAERLVPFLAAESPAVQAAAIRALHRLDIDLIAPRLNRFLQHGSPRVKTAALEAYVQCDKPSALQFLRTMTESVQPAIRRQVLSLLPFIDYPSVEPLLLKMFLEEREPALKEQVGLLIGSNPTRAGIEALFTATHSDDGTILPEGRELWSLTVPPAIPSVFPDLETLEKSCLEAHQARTARERTRAAPRKTRAPKPASLVSSGADRALSPRWHALIVVGVVAWLGLVVRFWPTEPTSPPPAAQGLVPSPGGPTSSPGSSAGQPAATWNPPATTPTAGTHVRDTRRLRGTRQRLPFVEPPPPPPPR